MVLGDCLVVLSIMKLLEVMVILITTKNVLELLVSLELLESTGSHEFSIQWK